MIGPTHGGPLEEGAAVEEEDTEGEDELVRMTDVSRVTDTDTLPGTAGVNEPDGLVPDLAHDPVDDQVPADPDQADLDPGPNPGPNLSLIPDLDPAKGNESLDLETERGDLLETNDPDPRTGKQNEDDLVQNQNQDQSLKTENLDPNLENANLKIDLVLNLEKRMLKPSLSQDLSQSHGPDLNLEESLDPDPDLDRKELKEANLDHLM